MRMLNRLSARHKPFLAGMLSLLTVCMQKCQSLLHSSRGRRALLEALIVQVIVILLVCALSDANFDVLTETNRTSSTSELFGFYCLCTLFWLSLRWRLRPPRRSKWQQILVEIEMAALLFFELILSASLLFLIVENTILFVPLFAPSYTSRLSGMSEQIVVIALACCFAFLALRIGLCLLHFWNRLRRSRLRWALTHAHLMFIVIGAGIVSIPFACIILLYKGNPLNLLAFLLGLLAITCVAIMCVLPPSALVSFFFARHLMRRIERAHRRNQFPAGGDYTVRVIVDGQDEIARLQADFNAMATELERAMR